MILTLAMINLGYSTEVFVANENNAFDTLPNDIWTDRIYSKTFSTLQDDTTNYFLSRVIMDEPQENLMTIQILNEIGNNTMEFKLIVTSFIGGSPVLNTQTFNLSPNEQQAFAVLTTEEEEEIDLAIRCSSGCDNSSLNGYKAVFQLYDDREKTITDAMDIFLSAVTDVINYNIILWRILVYVVIFIVAGGFVASLVAVALYLFSLIKKIEKGKGVVNTKSSDKEDN